MHGLMISVLHLQSQDLSFDCWTARCLLEHSTSFCIAPIYSTHMINLAKEQKCCRLRYLFSVETNSPAILTQNFEDNILKTILLRIAPVMYL